MESLKPRIRHFQTPGEAQALDLVLMCVRNQVRESPLPLEARLGVVAP
jgi:hypothetical protein